MVNQLTPEELEQLTNLNKQADKIVFELGLLDFQKYSMYKELAKVDQVNEQLSQELLKKYGEGELNLKEGTFTTKDEEK